MQLVTDNGQAVPLKMQILRLCIRNFLFPLVVIEFFLGGKQFLHDWATKSFVVNKGEIPSRTFQWRKFGWISTNVFLVSICILAGLSSSWFGRSLGYWASDIADQINRMPVSARMQKLLSEQDHPRPNWRDDQEQLAIDSRILDNLGKVCYLEDKENRTAEEDLELLLAGQLEVRYRHSRLASVVPIEDSSRSIVRKFSTFICLPDDRLKAVMDKQASYTKEPSQTTRQAALCLVAQELFFAHLPDEDYCNVDYLKHLKTTEEKLDYLKCLETLYVNFMSEQSYQTESGSFKHQVTELERKWNITPSKIQTHKALHLAWAQRLL